MYKAALFDLDGVVFDTEGQYSIFWGEMGRRYLPEVADFGERIKGMTLVQIFSAYFPATGSVRQEITSALNDFERNMSYEFVAGFESFAEELRKRGIKTAVVTSSNLAKMQCVYKARPEFKSLFDAILTSEDFAHSKPDPDCYLKAAARFGLSPSECVGFEDSVNGLRAVNAAGMTCVGLATTNPREIVSRYTGIVIDNYKDNAVLKLF